VELGGSMGNKYYQDDGMSKKKTYKMNPKVHNHIYCFKSDSPPFRSKVKHCGYCGRPIVRGQKCYFEGAGGFYCNSKHCKKYWNFVNSSKEEWTMSAPPNNKKPITLSEAIDKGFVKIGYC